MGKLKILMADDQQAEVQEARIALKEMAHVVTSTAHYDEALKLAKEISFDIAVVDLGWYLDDSLPSHLKDSEDAGVAGWQILDAIKAKNSNTIRILYSARTDTPKITQACAEQGIYCVQKRFTSEGRLHLADVVKVIARGLSNESDLKARIQKLEFESANARQHIHELEMYKSANDADERKFRRILTSTILVPTIAFVLFVAAWLLTQQLAIAIAAFLGGSFLSLATLRAIGAIGTADLKYLGTLMGSLFRKS